MSSKISSETLTQDEIDSLLSMDVDESSVDNGYTKYDLKKDVIIRGQMPALEMINSRFSRMYRLSLFNILSKSVEVESVNVEVVKFNEVINKLSVPTSLNIVKVNPLKGRGLFIYEAPLVYAFVENFFGGRGTMITKIEGRDFTPVESRVIESMRSAAFVDFENAWQSIIPVEFHFAGSEVNPRFASVVSGTELVIVSRFKVDLESGGGHFIVVYPLSMVEPIREILQSGQQTEASDIDDRWQSALKEETDFIDIELSVELGRTEIKFEDLVRLSSGSILPIKLREDVLVSAEGLPLMRGVFGQHNGFLAVKIKESVKRPSGAAGDTDGASGEIEMF